MSRLVVGADQGGYHDVIPPPQRATPAGAPRLRADRVPADLPLIGRGSPTSWDLALARQMMRAPGPRSDSASGIALFNRE